MWGACMHQQIHHLMLLLLADVQSGGIQHGGPRSVHYQGVVGSMRLANHALNLWLGCSQTIRPQAASFCRMEGSVLPPAAVPSGHVWP